MQNPFARSVAVLFYRYVLDSSSSTTRTSIVLGCLECCFTTTATFTLSPSRVARNMLINSGAGGLFLSGEELTMAKLLLENCIRLLRDSHSDRVNVRPSSLVLVVHGGPALHLSLLGILALTTI